MPSHNTRYLQSNDSYFSARALAIFSVDFFYIKKDFTYVDRVWLFPLKSALELLQQTCVVPDEHSDLLIICSGTCFMHRVWCLVPFTSVLIIWHIAYTLHWRHNYHDGVSNHQPHGCILNGLFRRRSKKTSKLRVIGLCAGNSPGPVNKGPVTRKMFPFDDVIMYIQLCDTSVHIHILHM